MTPTERQKACRLIAEGIEGFEAVNDDLSHPESFYLWNECGHVCAPLGHATFDTKESAWAALCPTYTDLTSLFRAVSALPKPILQHFALMRRGIAQDHIPFDVNPNDERWVCYLMGERYWYDTIEAAIFNALHAYALTLLDKE